MRLLVVIERELAGAIRQALERDGYTPAIAHSENQALRLAQSLSFGTIVVDREPPRLEGFEIVRLLRRAGIVSPILMLIDKEAIRDIGKVSECGADDFLLKPFSLMELTARLRALRPHGRVPGPRILKFADLALDPSTHQVSRDGAAIPLTRKEFLLLESLMRGSGRVVHRAELIRAVWDAELVEGNTLDAFIRLLRKKIDRGRDVKLIRTVRGFGYRLASE